MARLIINRLCDQPIEFADVSSEWVIEAFDKLSTLKPPGEEPRKEYVDVIYTTAKRLRSIRIHWDNFANVEMTF